MDNTNEGQQAAVNQVYDYAAKLMVKDKKSAAETKKDLVAQGLSEESASIIVENLEKQIKEAKKARAKKDMLYGALWCVGGTVATLANIGFIFWGAIVFGAIQFIRGVANA